MTDDTKICDEREISGTNIIPISSQTFGLGHFVLHPWIIPGQFFITHVYAVVIVEIIKKK